MPRPTMRSSLACLTKKRLILLARQFEQKVPQPEPKAAFIDALARARSVPFAAVLDELPIAELRAILQAHPANARR